MMDVQPFGPGVHRISEQRIIDDLARTPLEHWTSMDIAAHTQARVKADAGRKDT